MWERDQKNCKEGCTASWWKYWIHQTVARYHLVWYWSGLESGENWREHPPFHWPWKHVKDDKTEMGQTCLDGKVFIEGHEVRRWIQHDGEQALKGLTQSFAEYLYLCNICRTDAMWSGNAICSKFQGISAKDIGEGEKLCDSARAYDEWNGKWSYWENQLCKRMMGMKSTPIVGSKDHSTLAVIRYVCTEDC